MKLQKLMAMILCVFLLSNICFAGAGIAEDLTDIGDASEVEAVQPEAEVSVVEDEVPEAADIPDAGVEDTGISDAVEGVSAAEEIEAASEMPAEIAEVADEDTAVQPTGYALLTVNTYVYADTASDDMIGRFAEREIVQLPEGDGDGRIAVRFSYDGETYNAAIDSADVMDITVEPVTVNDNEVPVVNEFEGKIIEVQLTPEEWLEQNADRFFPKKMVYEEGLMNVDSMDLGVTSKLWVRGGISPAYAYVDSDEAVMMMNTPSTFSIEIGGFTPTQYVYSIYDQEFDAPDNYYYCDVYMQSTTSNTITFTPEYEGRYFLAVYAYDAAGNYVNFESGIFETANSSDATKNTAVYGKVKSVVSSVVTSSMDEYDIALALHDWLVKNVTYASSAPSKTSAAIYHAAGALLNGQAVCEGYAEAYRMLLSEAGVKSTIIISKKGDHAWNLVRINGAWYHVDCAWDDPIGASADYVSYEYFALTDAQLAAKDSSIHKWNETSTTTSMVPATSMTGIRISFSTSNELLKQLQKLTEVPQKFYAYYTGKATTSQESVVKSCASSAFKAYSNTVSRNGQLYLVALKNTTGATDTVSSTDVNTGITLPSNLKIGVGESVTMPLTCTSSTQKGTVVYKTSDENCISVDSKTGVIKGLKQGSATITATASGNQTAVCNVTVGAKATQITLTQSNVDVSVGESFKLSTCVTGTAYTLKWSSSNSDVASVESDGTVTALTAGSTTITVQTYAGNSASCDVTVKEKAKAITAPEIVELGVGQTYQLNPVFVPENAGGSATYTSSKASVAKISSSGKITAKAQGTAIITVEDASGNTAQTTITVKKAPTKVTLSAKSCQLGVGETYKLTPSVPNGCATGVYTFKSSSSKIAVVDENGTVIPKNTGKATITVKTYNGKQATCKLTIKAAPESVKMAKSSVELNVGQTVKMKAVVSANADDKLVWSASGNAVTVDNEGNVKAEKVGTATVKAMTFNGLVTECAVNVLAAPTSIQLSAKKLQISALKTYVLNAKSYPESTSETLTYKSGNTKVASVNSAGKITARKAGTAIITVETYNGVKSTCAVTVVKKQDVLEASGGSLGDGTAIADYPPALGSGSKDTGRDDGDILLSSDVPVLTSEKQAFAVVMPVVIAVLLLTGCAFVLVHKKRRRR